MTASLKWATLTVAVAFLLWLARRFRISIAPGMSREWLAEEEETRRRRALEWTGVGYDGRFKK